jgi:hypothetical protein
VDLRFLPRKSTVSPWKISSSSILAGDKCTAEGSFWARGRQTKRAANKMGACGVREAATHGPHTAEERHVP